MAIGVMAAGGNCAQAVLCVFCEELGLEKGMALKLASGFGSGMARRQEVCGALTGGLMVIGLKHGQAREDNMAAKEAAYRLSREMMERFQARFGSCLCRELLPGLDLATEAGHARYKEEGWSERICRPCVRFAVRILEEII